MIKILLFIIFFYYSWKLLGKLLFGEREQKPHYSPEHSFDKSIEKDVTSRVKVIEEK